jgi:general secretion pathway protein G
MEGRFMNGKQKAFTLIELLVVLLIIGLLAAFVAPSVYKRISPAKQSAAKAQIKSMGSALDSYFVDVGRYPTSQQGLQSLVAAPTGTGQWDGPYLQNELPLDPWGNAYIYHAPGRNGPYEIISLGSDGKEGGEGEARDINSWKAN